MSAHIADDLPRLLTGEASREETLAAAEHLRTCPDCQQELVSAVVAHASLTSARRFAPEVVAPAADDSYAPAAAPADGTQADSLPKLSEMFAQVRAEANSPERGARLPRRRWLAAAGAAAVVATGAGIAAAELLSPSPSTHPAAQAVRLEPVGALHASATATISGGTMHIDATALPKLDASRQYEVWLVASSGTRLRPLGYIGADRTAALPVPTQVMASYNDIAISIQKTDQVQFSGDMVARGQYT